MASRRTVATLSMTASPASNAASSAHNSQSPQKRSDPSTQSAAAGETAANSTTQASLHEIEWCKAQDARSAQSFTNYTSNEPIERLAEGAVFKQLVRAAPSNDARIPPDRASVRIHFIGYYYVAAPTQNDPYNQYAVEFDNSYARNEPVAFRLGQGAVIRGWDTAVATMRVGEISKFIVKAQYAYGLNPWGSRPRRNAAKQQQQQQSASANSATETESSDTKANASIDAEDDSTAAAAEPSESDKAPPKYLPSPCEDYLQVAHNTPFSFIIELLSYEHTQKVTEDGGIVKRIARHAPIDECLRPNDGARVTLRYRGRVKRMQQQQQTPSQQQQQQAAQSNASIVIEEQPDDEERKPEQSEQPEQQQKQQVPNQQTETENDWFDTQHWSEPTTITVGHDALMIFGLELAIKNMYKGEHSICTIRPDYGLTKLHLSEYPQLAQQLCVDEQTLSHTWLEYECECLWFEKANETWSLNEEQKLEYMSHWKSCGNTMTQRHEYTRALRLYKKCTSTFEYDAYLSTEMKRRCSELKAQAYSNMALCYSKLNKWSDAMECCDHALKRDPSMVKALYRRALTHLQQHNLTRALEDLQRASELDASNAAVRQSLQQLKRQIASTTRAEQSTFSGMFQRIELIDPKEEAVSRVKTAKGAKKALKSVVLSAQQHVHTPSTLATTHRQFQAAVQEELAQRTGAAAVTAKDSPEGTNAEQQA